MKFMWKDFRNAYYIEMLYLPHFNSPTSIHRTVFIIHIIYRETNHCADILLSSTYMYNILT